MCFQTAVMISEAVLAQVKGKSVPLYGIFLDDQYVGSFQYATARALHASLASLKLVKRLPKFPKRSGGGEKASRKCREQLQAYFTVRMTARKSRPRLQAPVFDPSAIAHSLCV